MTSIGFSRKNGEWNKTSNFKSRDILVTLEDDGMLNDIYSPDQLPDFRLKAHPPPPPRQCIPQPPADFDTEESELDTDLPPAPVQLPVGMATGLLHTGYP